jgi:beta-lactamase class A
MVALVIIIQLLYPQDQLLPYANIDGLSVGGWHKDDAVWDLDRHYLSKRVRIYFGTNQMPYRSPTTGEIGIMVKNQARIDQMNYPWWLRLVPTSLAWANHFIKAQAPQYETNKQTLQTYINKELGQSCDVMPKDAGVVYEDTVLKVVESAVGGTCQPAEIVTALTSVHPELQQDTTVRITMTEIQPAISTATAQRFVTSLTDRIGLGIPIKTDSDTIILPAREILSWLDVTSNEGVLTPHLNSDRATDYLTKNLAPKVAVASGVTKVSTRDFVETDRQEGVSGQTLNIDSTLTGIVSYLTMQREEAAVVTDMTSPRIEYTRSYNPTDTGLSALLANFAKDHAGTFGMSFVELSGQHRRATYDENRVFVTASTYKLFVAYSTLKRIDAGLWSWNDADIANGRNLSTCFDDMIIRSDNACAEALLKRVGYREATNEIRAVGLASTSFIAGNTPQSTPSDEALFLAQLELGQLPLAAESRDRLLGVMKRNIYQQGIPAGTDSVVADKVGFLWGLLHDAAVVYSPGGTYVLVIMTDGSSWKAIADLTRQIESLRSS